MRGRGKARRAERRGGFALDQAPEPFGYACPWCPTVVVDAGLLPAVRVFEDHLDRHMAAGVPVLLPRLAS